MCVPRTNAHRKAAPSASTGGTLELSHSGVEKVIACRHTQEHTLLGSPLLWQRGRRIRSEATRMNLVADCDLLMCKHRCNLGKDVRQIIIEIRFLIVKIRTNNCADERFPAVAGRSFPRFSFSYY